MVRRGKAGDDSPATPFKKKSINNKTIWDMSLKLGKAFIAALRTNEDLMRRLGQTKSTEKYIATPARLFTVARPKSEDDADTIPYIIIEHNGINADGTKEDYESNDTCTIGVLCVAEKYAQLVEITETVRETIKKHLRGDNTFYIHDYVFSANTVNYDPDKPCYYQTLTYNVSTQQI